MDNDRGVWHTKSSARAQNRLPASQKPSSDPREKKEPQPRNKGSADRGHGQGQAQGQGTSKQSGQGLETAQRSDTIPTPAAQEHIPINGYNAREVESAMKSPVEPLPMMYKPAEKPHSGARSGSMPWDFKRMYCRL